jgi:hypothetical protein
LSAAEALTRQIDHSAHTKPANGELGTPGAINRPTQIPETPLLVDSTRMARSTNHRAGEAAANGKFDASMRP